MGFRQIRLSPVIVDASEVGVGGAEEVGCGAGDWCLSRSFT